MDRTDLYQCLSRIGKLVESPERLRILDCLCQTERSVESISEVTGLPYKTVSHHLQKLTTNGFTSRRKDGRNVLYSVSGLEVAAFMRSMLKLSENLYPEIPLSLAALRPNRLERIEDLPESDPLIVDLRPEEEFDEAHIPGALNIPYDQLEDRKDELPMNSPVLAYCRDEYCELADSAVLLLRKTGRLAWRLEDSVLARLTEGRQIERKEKNR